MFTRTLKRLIAKIGLAAILMTQLMVAAYACPIMAGSSEMMQSAMAEDSQAAMPGCSEHDTSNSNLCLQHCQAGSQSVQTTPQVSAPAVALIPLTILEPVQPVSGLGITAFSVFPEREASPPPLVRFRVLRI